MKRQLASLAFPLLMVPLALGSGCVAAADSTDAPAGADEAVGEAQQAATTCVTLQRTGAAGQVWDTTVATSSPDKNYGSSWSLAAGLQYGNIGLLRFDLGAIPPGSYISSAVATVNVYGYGGAPVDVHVLGAPWNELTVTYNTRPFILSLTPDGTFPGAAVGAVTANPNFKPMSADLTGLVRRWHAGAAPNYGVALFDSSYLTAIASSDWQTSTSVRPKLTVCHQPSPCASNPCQNGGVCTATTATTYTCACPAGATGANCQTLTASCNCDFDSAMGAWQAGVASAGVDTISTATDAFLSQCLGHTVSLNTSFYLVGGDAVAAAAVTSAVAALDPSDPNCFANWQTAVFTAAGTAGFSDILFAGKDPTSLGSTGSTPFSTTYCGSYLAKLQGDNSAVLTTSPTQDTACKARLRAAGAASGQPAPVPDLPAPFALLAPALLGLAQIGRRLARRQGK